MKLAKTLKDRELSSEVLMPVKPLVETLVDELISGYDTQLAKDGKYLTESDKKALRKYLRTGASVTLSISSEVTEKKLEDWAIYPTDAKQSFLTAYAGDVDAD